MFFVSFVSVSAGTVLVEDVFSDISADYKYRNELQLLYDRGMILPNVTGKFSPDEYLNRDEFVGISMEVICNRCIQPHTEIEFIDEFKNSDVYFDIDNSNPYFYCVAEADKQNYVKGYDISQSCEDGTYQFGERPFCSYNRINLEEAVAVLLRNSGIFTIDDNQNVISKIYDGIVTENIANDVAPKDHLGQPYTFYGYFKKALDFHIVEYDEQGNEKIYRLLEKDAQGNLHPNDPVTNEDFLKMSYIALKSNSCSDIVDNSLALALDVWEKTCQQGDTDCVISELNDPLDTYDFTPDVKGYCEGGIDDPTGYSWRFYNRTNGDEFFHSGTFLDNIKLPSVGEWRVYLTVRDTCGNSAQVYSTIIVAEEPKDEIALNVDIIADPIMGYEDLLVDFEAVIYGGEGPFTYEWDFADGTEIGFGKNIEHVFTQDGVYEVTLTVTDSQGRKGTATVIIKVLENEDKCQQDTDGDGINDCIDQCPLVSGDITNNGCPIFERACSVTCGCDEGYTCSDSNPLTCGAGVCLPIEVKTSCLYNPTIGSIFGSTMCTSCPCNTNLDFFADIRKCDLVFPAITSPNAKNIYSQGKIWQVQ